MKRMILAALLLSAGACSRQAEKTDAKVDLQSARVSQIETRLADMGTAQANRTAELKKSLEQALADHAKNNDIVERQLRALEEKVVGIDSSLKALESSVRKMETAEKIPAPVVSSQSQESDFIQPPQDPFPVRVFDVAGKKVKTGSHTSTRTVETDEIYRDSFGNKSKRLVQQEYNVDEFGYRIFFSLQNLTRTDKEVSCDAGSSAQRITLPAEGITTNAFVDAALGANLSVRVGGYSRDFPVSY